jgi:hypothetical protein
MSNIAAVAKSWVSTSLRAQGFVRSMEDIDNDRIALAVMLLMEAGRMMEDLSPEFARALPDEAAMSARVELLDRIGSDLRALTLAARALLSHAGPDLNKLG